MIQEPFTNGYSILHRLNPCLKVVFATLYSFVVALSDRFPVITIAILLSFVLIIIAQFDFVLLLKRIAIVNGLILLFWLVLPFTFEGEALFTIGPFIATMEGVIFAAKITLKCNAILLAFMALIASTPVSALGYALNRLHIPEKLVQLLLLTYRYMFVIEKEYHRLATAAKIRGFRPGNNLHTYRTYAYMIGMLFVRAISRAQRVHQAMLCRGFHGRFYCLREFSFTRLDLIWSVFMAVVIMVLEILNFSAGW
jgi:cobalt/nickel transport system permease protein